ncbi:MAG TPA: replication-associated recombination protein A [Candidatus Manganitrophaceae bacterium]
MRPKDLSEFVGQAHLVGPGKFLRRAIESDRIASLILFGPPGCGKTALAGLIAGYSRAAFNDLNAVTSGVADLRRVIGEAQKEKAASGRKTLLFVDEIHRFNKSQQSALLPDVEKGNITLVGASTQNPFFSIIPALASRSQIVELKPLPREALQTLLGRALTDPERGFGKIKVDLSEEGERRLLDASEGDARRLLNALEIGVTTTPAGPDGIVHFDLTVAEESVQKKGLVYENEESHYDTISAFIKSMRGSDPDAALYWLAKMIYAGEDPLFIARRLIICAAEDVGNADPRALVLAVSALHALEAIGMPEGRIPLAQAVVYVACAPKSNAAYRGIEAALEEIESGRVMEVPSALKDASYPSAKKLGRGAGYLYPHDYPGHFIPQAYLPEERFFYDPSDQGEEKKISDRLRLLRASTGEGEKKKSIPRKQ